jgi:uncharacterized protein YndB with AHSA1/START domain
MGAEDVTVNQKFSADAERVYDAFLDVSTARQFLFATRQGKILRAEIDPRVGGALTIVDLRGKHEFVHTGHYVELERPSRIVFTFSVPRFSEDVATVEIDITTNEVGCSVELTHRAVPEPLVEGARAEWARMLAKADSVLAGS